jgi:hypothetical protein
MKLVIYISFEVFTAVTMKNGVFWDVAPSPKRGILNKNRTVDNVQNYGIYIITIFTNVEIILIKKAILKHFPHN